MSAFRKLSSIYVFSYFPFGFEGRIWGLIVSVPDYCLSFYFPRQSKADPFYLCLSEMLMSFLAILSRRIIGELIYSLHRSFIDIGPSHSDSLFSNFFSSITARQIEAKFHAEPPGIGERNFVQMV